MSDHLQTHLGTSDIRLEIRLEGNRIFVKGRLAGWLAVDAKNQRIFVSPRRRAEHFFRMFGGWGISRDLLQFLKGQFVNKVHLKLDDGKVIAASVFDWLNRGVDYHKEPYEPQIILVEQVFREVTN